MENEQNFFFQVQAPNEEQTVDLNLIKLSRRWVFWENYENKEKGNKIDWELSIKKIFKIDDIITFWQFWNNYPGSDPPAIFYNGTTIKQYFFPNKISFFKEKNRIVGLNLFEEGISPKWEDKLNANGTTLTLNYEIRDKDDIGLFLNLIKQYWTKLMIIIMGEGFKLNNFV